MKEQCKQSQEARSSHTTG